MTTGVAFVGAAAARDYGAVFSRLRWMRAAGANAAAVLAEDADPDASETFAGADRWLVVADPRSLPAPSFAFPGVSPGPPVRAGALSASGPSGAVHTIRELETFPAALDAPPGDGGEAPAVALWPSVFAPRAGEGAAGFCSRALAAAGRSGSAARFAAVLPGDPSASERPELSTRLPPGVTRLLDVGCGAGGTSAALKARNSRIEVTGIERDPAAAAVAAPRLDRLLVGDARRLISSLAESGERFDGFLFGDILEHIGEPIELLAAARSAALPGATLVASVPNAGHLSLVRDLLLGRFDPAPAGLADAGHLRWFTRDFLVRSLEEAGWEAVSVEGSVGASTDGAEDFFSFFRGFPGLDAAALSVYQWIAVARPA